MAKKKIGTARKKRPAKKPAMKKAAARGVRGKAKKDADSLRLSSVVPGLTVSDLARSLAWYCDVLGCTIKERWEPEGVLVGAELAAGDVRFMIGQDDWRKGRDRVKGAGFRLYCSTTQDVDRLAAAIQARGGTLADEPRDGWGMRAFAIEDPDGFKITIARPLKR